MTYLNKARKIIRFSKGRTVQQEYYKVMTDLYREYGIEKANKSVEKAVKYLDKKRKTKNKDISKVENIIFNTYFTGIDQIFRKTIKEQTTKLYNYRRKAFKKAEFEENEITAIDQRTVNALIESQITFIYVHAGETLIAKAFNKYMAEAIKQGMTMRETAEYVMDKVKFKLPAKFNKTYGDELLGLNAKKYYYKMVTQLNAYRVRSFAHIRDRQYLGIKGYKIIPRPDACDICIAASEQTYYTKDQARQMEKYIEATETNDIEAMKKSQPFYSVEDIEDGAKGVTIPLHPNCYCDEEDIDE